MPQRGRPLPHRALRHRARRPPARLPAGRAGHAGRDAARLPARQGALRRRLVDPTAAGAVARVRRARRRGARRAARRCSAAELVETGKDEWARQEFDHLRSFEPAAARRRLAAYVRACTGCAAVARWPPYASCGRPATRSPSSATSRPAGSSPTPRSSPPPRRCPTDRDALLATKGFHGRGAERYATRWVAALSARRRARRGRPADPRPARRRPAAAARLGREGPGRRPPARRSPARR